VEGLEKAMSGEKFLPAFIEDEEYCSCPEEKDEGAEEVD
jgi:hypothetical protein